jgi:hypothetical protein
MEYPNLFLLCRVDRLVWKDKVIFLGALLWLRCHLTVPTRPTAWTKMVWFVLGMRHILDPLSIVEGRLIDAR